MENVPIKANGYDARTAPFFFLYGGFVESGSMNLAGVDGDYWSSTTHSSTETYRLYLNPDDINPSVPAWHYGGISIRCLAR